MEKTRRHILKELLETERQYIMRFSPLLLRQLAVSFLSLFYSFLICTHARTHTHTHTLSLTHSLELFQLEFEQPLTQMKKPYIKKGNIERIFAPLRGILEVWRKIYLLTS